MVILRKVVKIIDVIDDAFAYLAGFLIVALMVLISADTLLRYAFRQPVWWASEISEYALLYITFLGAAWLVKQDGHVRMDIVLHSLPASVQAWVKFVTAVVGAIICLIIVWYGVQVGWGHLQTGQTIPTRLEPPKYLLTGIIPVGSLLLAVGFVRQAQRYFAEAKRTRRSNEVGVEWSGS